MLQVILLHTARGLSGVPVGNPVHQDLKAIQQAAENSAALTSQLLGFARKQSVSPRMVDLNETTREILKMLRPLVGEAIAIDWKPAQRLWGVLVDPSQLNQVLANLCANARDAIEDVGCITIETRNITLDDDAATYHQDAMPGDYVLLSVSDTGCGMDEETLKHVCEPFFTTKAIGAGTGLGLASAYGIAQQNGGFLQIQSKLKLGTMCNFYLPRHEGEIVTEAMASASSAENRGETVLFVEDEPNILALGKVLLEGLGYHVLAANSPREAIIMASGSTKEIHLLITDVIMPEMNGNDLARAISSLRPSLRCLFISGYTADLINSRTKFGEDVVFLQKPFTPEAFEQKVREALGRT